MVVWQYMTAIQFQRTFGLPHPVATIFLFLLFEWRTVSPLHLPPHIFDERNVKLKATVFAVHAVLTYEWHPKLKILMDVPLKDIGDARAFILQEAISRMRAGKVNIKPGFDGEYGKIEIFVSFPKELLTSVRNESMHFVIFGNT